MKNEPLQTNISDRATEFAYGVLAGEYLAGPHVRAACQRHIDDLAGGAARGLFWDLDAADRAIDFCGDVLRLNGGQFEGQPFVLNPWQCFVMGSIYGWKASDGYRRFRTAYIETGKGSGKSPLAAAVGLYGLVADDESRAEVYAAATKRDQAMILFRDAVAMVDQSPILAKRLEKSGRAEKVWNLAHHASGSFFRAIAADEGQSGPRPHVALLDEIHEHRTRVVVDLMRAGTKSRRQALIFMITNSGHDRTSVCYSYHETGIRVCSGQLTDDSLFAFICGVDEGDDPINDESCWPKANPSLQFGLAGDENGGIPGYKYLREQVREARNMPGKVAVVQRLNFCIWTQADNPWISWEVWDGANDPAPMRILRNRPAVGALDLSSTTDLTSFVLIFYPTDSDPVWRLLSYFWIPDHALKDREDRDKVPYQQWIAEGHLETTPGRAISKLHVLRRLQTICDYFDVRKIGYDRWRIEDLIQLMGEHGITLPELSPFGQGFKDMSPAVDEFERRLLGESLGTDEPDDRELIQPLKHDGNPVLTWCASNAVVVSDPANNRKVDKAKSIGRIDGIVASVMATGVSGSAAPDSGVSIYDKGVGI